MASFTNNRAPVDGWTAVHFVAGAAAGGAGLPWWAAIGVGVVYEGAEQVVERTELGRQLFGSDCPESVANVAVDLTSWMAGWGAGAGVRALMMGGGT
ncbi:MAG: hypothetical protein ACOCUS_00780 [Polyangiales bacterium]